MINTIKPFIFVVNAVFIGEVGIPFLEVFGYIVPDLAPVGAVVIIVVAFRTEGDDVLLDPETSLSATDIVRIR